MRIEDALRMAFEADLDLVEVAPEAKPPVCKLMDFGKFKYESAVKAREARKNQVNTVIKEMKLRPKIDQHDYETKKNHVERFLGQGDKVKITIMFRGREQSRPELGYKLLQKLAADIGDLAVVESSPVQDGRNMTMVLAPTRRKTADKTPKQDKHAKAETADAPVEAKAPVAKAASKPAPVEVDAVEVVEVAAPVEATETPETSDVAVEAAPPAKKAAAKKAPAKKAPAKKAVAKTEESE